MTAPTMLPMVVRFTVHGKPIPQKRPRVTVNGTYNPPNAWRDSIAWEAPQHFRGWDTSGRYSLTVVLYGAGKRGDWDNFGKAVSDALEGIAWRNDNQVDDGRVIRMHCKTKYPSALIVVKAL